MFGSRGLDIIGIFHPKPPGKWTMEKVRRAADEKHFTFPIAVDGDWTALNLGGSQGIAISLLYRF
jgi:hypothetical protein